METTTACLNDHHNFSDYDDDDDDYNNHRNRRRVFSLLPPPSFAFPESIEEEELEWISNKDAFAMAESFVDILPNHPSISSATTTATTTTTTTTTSLDNNVSSHLSLSPVSVLENSSTTSCSNNNGSGIGSGSGSGGYVNINNLRCFFKVPGKARTKRPNRRREMSGERFQCWEKVRVGHGPGPGLGLGPRKSGIGRKCLHCGSEKTPQWRAGPNGPKTLCNACGVRYKSGRLVPEYRPASSPTFSSELHSNSHRKIVEMRKQKMGDGEGEGEGDGGVF